MTPRRLVTAERRDEDSAETSLRPQRLAEFIGQQQAAAAIAAAARSVGEEADVSSLIRLGLKELAR
jgi:holliday junction DNA helicase RuvB